LVSVTVLVETGTMSTRVRVFITVHGTISVTHSNAGAGVGESTQGDCLQAWQARAFCPANEARRTRASSWVHLGLTCIVIYLQGGLSLRVSGSDAPDGRV
jgi:hypothetical protein